MIVLSDDDAAFCVVVVQAVLDGRSPDEQNLRDVLDLLAYGSDDDA